jgi:hypothetical protein
MLRAVDHLATRHVAALFLDPGLRKTSVTMAAFLRLKAEGKAKRMLVVAPMRVCRNQWRQEAAKWEEFRHLRFSFLHGPRKAEALAEDADIFLINPEGLDWLSKRFFGRKLPFDVVCFDELTKLKNSQSKRHKAIRPRLKGIPYRWGLTGTPSPNGYMDLFGQFLILDDGAALGRYITHFRDNYFQLDFNGFDYQLMPGGAKRIEDKIKPYVLQMTAEDYIYIPPMVPDPLELDWTPQARAQYMQMKTKMVAELPGHTVTAVNAASVYSKLSQMANGALYLDDTGKNVAVLHDIKLEALDDLVDSLNGQQLLVAYEFKHDRERLRQWFNKPGKRDRIHFIGSGVSEKDEARIITEWNTAKIQLMACHPASTGHGLNLQDSQCMHICWFSATWDLELWDQFIRRVRRSGNMAAHVIVHILIMKQSLDGVKLETISVKDVSQKRLMSALKAEILRDEDSPTAGDTTVTTTEGDNTPMSIMRLSKPNAAPAAPAAAQQPRQPAARPAATTGAAPKGWGGAGAAAHVPVQQPAAAPQPQTGAAPKGWGGKVQTVDPAEAQQRERIAEAITTGVVDTGTDATAEEAQAAFSPAIQAALNGQEPELPMGQGAEPAPVETKKTRKPRGAAATTTQTVEPEPVAATNEVAPPWIDNSAVDAALIHAKTEILKLVFGGESQTSLEEGIEMAKDLLAWVREA